MAWVPTTDFEEEVVASQPEYNFVYGQLSTPKKFQPRPKSHTDYAKTLKEHKKDKSSDMHSGASTLKAIATVQRIAGTKPLGEQPTLDDWNSTENVTRETIAMMRHFGLGPSNDGPLNENCTLSTGVEEKKMEIVFNGKKRMPVLFDEEFFKLKPRVSDPTGNNVNFEMSSITAEDNDSLDIEIKDKTQSTTSDERNKILKSGSNSTSLFETASGSLEYDSDVEERFYTANNSMDSIPQKMWPISKRNNSTFASSSSDRVHKPKKAFYTAKELYEKKRKNC